MGVDERFGHTGGPGGKQEESRCVDGGVEAGQAPRNPALPGDELRYATDVLVQSDPSQLGGEEGDRGQANINVDAIDQRQRDGRGQPEAGNDI